MSKLDIFTIDLRVILSIIVATGVYALLLKFLQKNSPHNVQTKGGGGQRPYEQCSKKLHFSLMTASLRGIVKKNGYYTGRLTVSGGSEDEEERDSHAPEGQLF